MLVGIFVSAIVIAYYFINVRPMNKEILSLREEATFVKSRVLEQGNVIRELREDVLRCATKISKKKGEK